MDVQQTKSEGWIMKGRGDWDDLVRTRAKKPAGSAAQWARETVATIGCQVALDAKAFTGRGNLRDLRHLVTDLDEVEQRMEALSSTSRALNGARLYLVVHRHRPTGYTFLRWRERSGAKRHLPWDEADARLADHPQAQRRWCSEASALAIQLNTDHLVLRERIKALRMQLWQTRSPVYARPIPEAG